MRVQLWETIDCHLRVLHLWCSLLQWLFCQRTCKWPLKNHPKWRVGERKKTVFCRKHDKKEIDIHCKTCQENICSLCVTKGHSGHKFNALIDIEMAIRKIIAEGAETLSQRAKKLDEVKDGMIKCSKEVPLYYSITHKCFSRFSVNTMKLFKNHSKKFARYWMILHIVSRQTSLWKVITPTYKTENNIFREWMERDGNKLGENVIYTPKLFRDLFEEL